MLRKMMIRCALAGALALAASSCFFNNEGQNSKYEATILVQYEPEYDYEKDQFLYTFFRDGKDSVSVNEYLSFGPVTHYTEVDAEGGLVGGFALCIGVDTLAAPDRRPARLAVFDKGGCDGSMAYAVFHDTTAALMPEHAIRFGVPNDMSSCVAGFVYVQNVQAVVQAVRYGNDLAGGPFTADDFLSLTITGSKNGKAAGKQTVKLVDGTKPLEKWTEVKLDDFGSIDAIDFHLEASRPDLPLYCCLDNLQFHYLEIY
jgi:hypothetical protein